VEASSLKGLNMDQIEMGGYLPLELNKGYSRFQNISPDNVLAVNTGRAAILYAVYNLKAKRIYIPYYYCTDVIRMLQNMDIEVLFYHIDKKFMPVDVAAGSDDIVLLVNYFGIMNEAVCSYAKKFQNVILDQSHGYYYEPILRSGVMNIYSCRKFIGVSDGAYLIGMNLDKPDLKQDMSFGRALHLCKSIEMGTGAAYQDHKKSEDILGQEYLQMSLLTKKILENADDTVIAQKRRANFLFLHEKLEKLQNLSICEEKIIPYVYPLLFHKDIHQALVQRKIYTPVLWSHLLDEKWNNTIEQHFARFLIPLPIDQRYSKKEMEYLAQVIYSEI